LKTRAKDNSNDEGDEQALFVGGKSRTKCNYVMDGRTTTDPKKQEVNE
jgi:hypothetical protein